MLSIVCLSLLLHQENSAMKCRMQFGSAYDQGFLEVLNDEHTQRMIRFQDWRIEISCIFRLGVE